MFILFGEFRQFGGSVQGIQSVLSNLNDYKTTTFDILAFGISRKKKQEIDSIFDIKTSQINKSKQNKT